jgi:hypothetical protein
MPTSILPAIGQDQTRSTSIAYLQWHGSIDPQIVKSLGSLAHHGVVGSNPTPHGNIAWALFAIESEEKFKTDPDNLYWFNLILKPDPFMDRWIALLKTQSELRLAIDHQQKTTLVLLLERTAIEGYIQLLETSLAEWKGKDLQLFNRYAQQVQNEIYDRIVPERIAAIRESTRAGESPETLLKLVGERAIVELPAGSELRELAGKNRSLEKMLDGWAANFDISNLSQFDTDLQENIRRDWLYTKNCLERSTPGRYRIPTNSANTWLWKLTCLDSLRLLWDSSQNLRLLLSENWRDLLDVADVPSPPIENIFIADFLHLRSNIDRTTDIIKSTHIHKVYGFQSAIVCMGTTGCESIHFRSSPTDNRVLVKYIINKTKDYNLCLFGSIDTIKGMIAWISPLIIDPEVTQIVNFLVAICYRDLLVCRDGMDGNNFRDVSTKKANKKTSQPSKIQLVARIKRDSSTSNINSTEEIKEKLGKYFRVEHVRKLPDGWVASPRQIALAKDYGFILPKQHTFVSPSKGEEDNIKTYRSISLIQLFLK